MEMGILSCLVFLLVGSTRAAAREGAKPMLMDQGNKISYPEGVSPDSICDSCLDVSRKAEKILFDPMLLAEVDTLSGEVCHTLPSHLTTKCLEDSSAYLEQTRLLLQQLFHVHEETLCGNIKLCLDKSASPTNSKLFSMSWILKELTDERACDACRRSAKDIITKLLQSKLRLKIMNVLREYCEDEAEDVDKCKDAIYKYAPVVISKLKKMRPNDFCRLIGVCDEGIFI